MVSLPCEKCNSHNRFLNNAHKAYVARGRLCCEL